MMRGEDGGAAGRRIFLVGFMGAGKTTVGRLVASRLGLPFSDLDRDVEEAAGKTVPAIFAERGESAFRELEREALRRAAERPPAVVATGGGAPCDPASLSLMRRRGLVIALHAPLETLRARAGGAGARPLLALPDADLEALYRRRVPVYRRAHAVVGTGDRSAEEAAALCAQLAARAGAIPDDLLGDAALLSLPGRAYPIVAAEGLLDRAGELCAASLPPGARNLGVVTDERVGPLYGGRLRRSLGGAGFNAREVAVPPGEAHKSASSLERVAEELARAGLDRRSAVAALGGGVVGDLAGLAAATLFRGVSFVQVPTTLVAMVDAAIGGKTAVNLAAGKNLLGAFWQPSLVLADTAVLATLPARERRAAFGELLKYALLDGEELYELTERLAPAIAAGGEIWDPRPPELSEIVRRCAAIKSWIVALDEREQTGERALLNLGHTLGHAIEAAAGYGVLLHGEAVALGLRAACRVSARLGLCDPALEARIAGTLERAGLDADLEPWLRAEVLERVGVDKKRAGGRVHFITLREVGRPEVVPVELEHLREILLPGRAG